MFGPAVIVAVAEKLRLAAALETAYAAYRVWPLGFKDLPCEFLYRARSACGNPFYDILESSCFRNSANLSLSSSGVLAEKL